MPWNCMTLRNAAISLHVPGIHWTAPQKTRLKSIWTYSTRMRGLSFLKVVCAKRTPLRSEHWILSREDLHQLVYSKMRKETPWSRKKITETDLEAILCFIKRSEPQERVWSWKGLAIEARIASSTQKIRRARDTMHYRRCIAFQSPRLLRNNC
jgi:hypothetical protein